MDAKQLTKLLDEYHIKRATRRDLEAAASQVRAEEKEICGRILSALQKAGLKKLADEYGRNVGIKKKKFVRILDWDAFFAHIQKTGEFDLMQRRPAVGAFIERAAEGHKVPGAQLDSFDDLSFTTTK